PQEVRSGFLRGGLEQLLRVVRPLPGGGDQRSGSREVQLVEAQAEFPTVTEQDVMREHDRRALRPAVLGRPGAWIERGAGRGIEKRIPVDPDLVVEPGGASRAIRPGQRGRIDGRGTYQRVSEST